MPSCTTTLSLSISTRMVAKQVSWSIALPLSAVRRNFAPPWLIKRDIPVSETMSSRRQSQAACQGCRKRRAKLLTWRSCHPAFQQRDLSKSPSSLGAASELSLPSAPLDAYSASLEIDGSTQVGWTRAHIRHLFDVLVTWDSICFCVLRRKEFLQDYETGSRRFCSSALVHALLALATRLINETENDSHILPSGWLGSNYFLRQASEMLQQQGSADSLPDIQALGILALYHIRCGRENEALKLAELCSERIRSLCLRETGVASMDEESVKVRATTYCGAISLRRMLYLTTGVLFNGYEQSHEDYSILDQDSYDGAGTNMMSPGTTDDATVSLQLANSQLLNIKMFQLTEWVHKVIVTHQRASRPSQQAVLLTYTKCLGWYRDVFELTGNSGNRSPFVLFIHMYYHFCLLCAFRPFVGTNFADTELQPHDMCTQAVQAILALAQSYDDLFTLRRVSALVPYFVCASGLFSLAVEDSGSNMDFDRHLSPRLTQEPQLPCLDGAGPSSGTASASRIKVSTVVQAGNLLSKMGESHPAAAMAAEKLNENLQTWRRAKAVRSSGA
ncbi:hypothetical protein LLEC1_03379 [Akanthomyces lecanii]|uniref:Transcription factor domain-containing protein n=1 Tax=Cordyceps confragosa TaxID=2714763 RepID=A0A179I1N4_CORDF|nr:hypothetical protein LLEC1_03379 [Akanthomyces lecanii]